MDKKVKKKYLNKLMSNGKVGRFNTSNITSNMIQFYCDAGFEFIFEVVKEKKSDK